MTWSIVARDVSGAFGVAVASKFFAVGALCPHALSHVGALATQALVNPLLAAPALEGMAQQRNPVELLAALLAADGGSAYRQFHMVDDLGRGAAHTGTSCIDWCGHILRDGFSVAGNMLAGPQVIEATAETYASHSFLPFAERLITALAAGEAAGGDKRGKQAAALLVYSGQDYPTLDLRVDDHFEPLLELRRLYDVSLERFQPFVECLPSRENPSGIVDRSVIEANIERFHAARGMSVGAGT
jgi:uncharacterized Ntn-hydrolase superfamily protein